MEELLCGYGYNNPSALTFTHLAETRWFGPGVAIVRCAVVWVFCAVFCAVLCTYLRQAQGQSKCCNQSENHDSGKRTGNRLFESGVMVRERVGCVC